MNPIPIPPRRLLAAAIVLAVAAACRSTGAPDPETEAALETFYADWEVEIGTAMAVLDDDDLARLESVWPRAEFEGTVDGVLSVLADEASLRPFVSRLRRFVETYPSNTVHYRLDTATVDRRMWHILVDTVNAELEGDMTRGLLDRVAATTRDEQERAMAFLAEHALRPPTFFVDEEILRRVRPTGATERIAEAQRGVLEGLLDDERMARLAELEARATLEDEPYALESMLSDLRGGAWAELDETRVAIGPCRRALQRHGARRAIPRAADVAATIDRILDPRAEAPQGSSLNDPVPVYV